MTSPRPKSRLAPAMIMAVVLLVALPILYVLSIGPAVVMAARGSLKEETYFKIYAPLGVVFDRWPSTDRAINWYARLWLRAFGEKTAK